MNTRNFNIAAGDEKVVAGLLALQGGFALHESTLRAMGVEVRMVRCSGDLASVDGLIIPGGESTTMLTLGNNDLWKSIQLFSKERPVWGTCAGSILISHRVVNPKQWSLGLIDITIERNSYGTQNDSFIASVPFQLKERCTLDCVFIRAPRILEVGDGVTILASFEDQPIMVEQNGIIATTFHPELSESQTIHEYFVEKIRST